MHINSFDHFQAHDSSIYWLDPWVKVVTVGAFILSTTLLPDGAWLGMMLSWAAVMGLTLAAVKVIFILPPTVIWRGSWGSAAADAGLMRFLSILLRSWIALQMAVLLTTTTRFPDILHALTTALAFVLVLQLIGQTLG